MSTAIPLNHSHLYQTEAFDVQRDTLCYLIDGKEGKLQAGQKVNISPHRPHTFWNESSTNEELCVHITVREGDKAGSDEEFVRNFYGYLSTVTMQGKKPNPLQTIRLLDDADVFLAECLLVLITI